MYKRAREDGITLQSRLEVRQTLQTCMFRWEIMYLGIGRYILRNILCYLSKQGYRDLMIHLICNYYCDSVALNDTNACYC